MTTTPDPPIWGCGISTAVKVPSVLSVTLGVKVLTSAGRYRRDSSFIVQVPTRSPVFGLVHPVDTHSTSNIAMRMSQDAEGVSRVVSVLWAGFAQAFSNGTRPCDAN